MENSKDFKPQLGEELRKLEDLSREDLLEYLKAAYCLVDSLDEELEYQNPEWYGSADLIMYSADFLRNLDNLKLDSDSTGYQL